MLSDTERTHEWGPQIALFVALLIAMLASSLPGCCKPKPLPVELPGPTSPHLVFNPPETGVEFADASRSDWPVAVVYQSPEEIITYREWVMDRQGGFSSDHNRPYRRFDSVRVGHTRR